MKARDSSFERWFNKALKKGRWMRVLQVVFLVFSVSFLAWRLLPSERSLTSFALYFAAVVLILTNAFFAAAHYIDDIYKINDFRSALAYLQIAMFGFRLPKANVCGGKIVFSGRFDSLNRIGGPGVLKIERDNVAVVQTLRGYKDVLAAGLHTLTRFDSIKEILSTEEQYEKIQNIETLTADGIRVGIKEVQIRFRIEGFVPPNSKGMPMAAFLPSKWAVKELAYQRNAPADGNLPLWTAAVKGKVSSIVCEHINNAYLSDLISPRETGEHPLDKLREKLESGETKETFKKMGVCFNWCYIGEVYAPEVDVDKEHLQIWFAKKSGAINVIRAQSASESFASQERGRAEGQSMLLQAIVRALQEIGVEGRDPAAVRKNLRNILLTRTAQILESQTSIYKTNHKGIYNEKRGEYKEDGSHDAKGEL